jgi:DNA-binding response OmpR family regulator
MPFISQRKTYPEKLCVMTALSKLAIHAANTARLSAAQAAKFDCAILAFNLAGVNGMKGCPMCGKELK